MTERAKTKAWVPREERRVSPTPTEIPPHPDHGDLPPCEMGIKTDHPCPRPAAWHYGYVYCCGEHMDWMRASDDYEDAELGLHHARRFLWKAQVEGFEHLETALGDVVLKAERHRLDMERQLEEAGKKADVPAA
jgi:hypothetical protein